MKELFEKYDGRKILIGEELHLVLGRVLGRNAYKLRAPDGREHEIESAKFRILVSQGKLFEHDADPDDAVFAQPSSMDPIAAYRADVVRRVLPLRNQGYTWKQVNSLVQRQMADHPLFLAYGRPFQDVRSTQEWTKKMQAGGIKALMSRTHLCGNRSPRYDSLFENVVLDLAEEGFLQTDRKTLSDLANEAAPRYLQICSGHGIKPGPHGQKAVKKIIASLPHADIVKSRLGKEESRQKLLLAERFHKIEAPLDRVEIDCTTANIKIVDASGDVVGRPVVCAIIDTATGVILALTVSLAAPRSELVARTVKQMLVPQTEDFFDRFKIVNRIQTFGVPLAIASDNGSENGGDIVEAIVERVGLEWQKCRPRRPEDKPFIERFFRELKRALSSLPGATETSELGPTERVEKSETEATLNLENVESFLQKWRYDVYAIRPRRRIETALRIAEAPFEAWKRLELKYDLPLPLDQHDVDDIFFRRRGSRRLHNYGIELECIQYYSPALAAHTKLVGPGSSMEIFADPTDIRSIIVVDTERSLRLRVPAKDPDIPAISFSELAVIRKRLKPRPEETLIAKEIMRELVRTFEEKPKPGTTKQRAKRQAEVRKRRAKEITDKTRRSTEVSDPAGIIVSRPAPASLKRPTQLPSVKQRKRET